MMTRSLGPHMLYMIQIRALKLQLCLGALLPQPNAPAFSSLFRFIFIFLPQCHLGLKLGRKLARQNVNKTGTGS